MNQAENPFQEHINALVEAFRDGKTDAAKKVTVASDDDVKWVKAQLYRAARNVKMGIRTRIVKNGTQFDVYFRVAPSKKTSTTSA